MSLLIINPLVEQRPTRYLAKFSSNEQCFNTLGDPGQHVHMTHYYYPDLAMVPRGKTAFVPGVPNEDHRPRFNPGPRPTNIEDVEMWAASKIYEPEMDPQTRLEWPNETLEQAMNRVSAFWGKTQLHIVTYRNPGSNCRFSVERRTWYRCSNIYECRRYDFSFWDFDENMNSSQLWNDIHELVWRRSNRAWWHVHCKIEEQRARMDPPETDWPEEPVSGGVGLYVQVVSLSTVPSDERSCTICSDQYPDTPNNSESQVVKLSCGHIFCRGCISRWLISPFTGNRVNTCPQCRQTPMVINPDAASSPMSPWTKFWRGLENRLSRDLDTNPTHDMVKVCHRTMMFIYDLVLESRSNQELTGYVDKRYQFWNYRCMNTIKFGLSKALCGEDGKLWSMVNLANAIDVEIGKHLRTAEDEIIVPPGFGPFMFCVIRRMVNSLRGEHASIVFMMESQLKNKPENTDTERSNNWFDQELDMDYEETDDHEVTFDYNILPQLTEQQRREGPQY
ncbi:hypothetical protein M501DRAFT_1031910 [Patellaria atrata CBS 101060]|uniref:RING-type domain-containing protein n=1 Tax=Patellaria atrata CBS 101060 TaxID=1346257 RepID=A0A9P4VRI0_9PEZI|nr:hypothetical protein M501DRAFT_1031910 [Patellaria atrata CBS 101060]